MRTSFVIGRIFGIPIGINYSWFIIFIIVTASLALFYFPENYPEWSVETYWAIGLVTSLLFFGSVLAHELSHSVVSIRSGIPVKSITLFIFGGVAQISREAAKPSAELLMAAAGPLSSLGIALFFAIIWFLSAGFSEPVAALAEWLMIINVSLALFNLIPGFPLDGGRVLRAILWAVTDYRKATRIAALSGQGIAYLFIVVGILVMFWGYWINGLWIAFIGWFLENAASGSYRQARLVEALQGFTARDIMSTDCPLVSGNLSLKELVNNYIMATGQRCFLVGDVEGLGGIVTLHNIKAVPQERWEGTTVAQAMTPAHSLTVVGPNEPAASVLEKMTGEDINQVPVVEGGKVIGMVRRDSLLQFIRTRSELGV